MRKSITYLSLALAISVTLAGCGTAKKNVSTEAPKSTIVQSANKDIRIPGETLTTDKTVINKDTVQGVFSKESTSQNSQKSSTGSQTNVTNNNTTNTNSGSSSNTGDNTSTSDNGSTSGSIGGSTGGSTTPSDNGGGTTTPSNPGSGDSGSTPTTPSDPTPTTPTDPPVVDTREADAQNYYDQAYNVLYRTGGDLNTAITVVDKAIEIYPQFKQYDLKLNIYMSMVSSGYPSAKSKEESYLTGTLIPKYGDSLNFQAELTRLYYLEGKFSSARSQYSRVGSLYSSSHSDKYTGKSFDSKCDDPDAVGSRIQFIKYLSTVYAEIVQRTRDNSASQSQLDQMMITSFNNGEYNDTKALYGSGSGAYYDYIQAFMETKTRVLYFQFVGAGYSNTSTPNLSSADYQKLVDLGNYFKTNLINNGVATSIARDVYNRESHGYLWGYMWSVIQQQLN